MARGLRLAAHTVGGQLERWGRDGGIEVRLALLAVVLVKLAVAAGTWLAANRGRRLERTLAWTAGLVLTLYGAVLTVAGIAIVAFGAADLSRSDDPRAVRWHAYVWDPWFLLWGLLRARRSRGEPFERYRPSVTRVWISPTSSAVGALVLETPGAGSVPVTPPGAV